MKQYTCLGCGTEFTSDRFRKYCSNRCNKAHNARTHRAGIIVPLPNECVLTEGVVCTDRKCETCGWNPKISRKRLATILGRADR